MITDFAGGQLNREIVVFSSPRSCLIVWSRETSSIVPSRVSLVILHTYPNLLSPVLSHGFVSFFDLSTDGVHSYIQSTVIGSVASFSHHVFANHRQESTAQDK